MKKITAYLSFIVCLFLAACGDSVQTLGDSPGDTATAYFDALYFSLSRTFRTSKYSFHSSSNVTGSKEVFFDKDLESKIECFKHDGVRFQLWTMVKGKLYLEE